MNSFLGPELVPPPKTRIIFPVLFFIATFFTTLLAGFWIQINFDSSNQQEIWFRLSRLLSNPSDVLSGLPYSCTILAILLAHEMGHYLTCQYYKVRATLPYMLPAPFAFGTFGAVIKIKSAFKNRHQLFDVGIAGPLCGFVLVVPALIIGLRHSREFVYTSSTISTLEFGEPLLFQLATRLFFPGDLDVDIHLHPIGWAAWFGMLATSINLLPIGQLDGGHIIYAIFGRRWHQLISYGTLASLILISLYSWPMLGYLVFALILFFLGLRHPSPDIDSPSLGKGRLCIALIGLIIFLLTLIVVPVRFIDHVGRL